MRPEINTRIKLPKNPNTSCLNNTLLKTSGSTNKEEIKKCLETNENRKTRIQNLWDAAKAVLRGKFITVESYLKKQEASQINNVNLHLKQLEKEEPKKPPNLAEGKKS